MFVFVKEITNKLQVIKILNLLYHNFMCSVVLLFSGIYPLHAIHSLLVSYVHSPISYVDSCATINVTEGRFRWLRILYRIKLRRLFPLLAEIRMI